MSPPASRPTAGSTMCTPRSRSTAMFSTTLGCSHISVCIAGHTHHGRAGGDQCVGQQIGRQTHSVGGDHPGGRRSHQDQVGTLADLGVRDRRGRVVPEFGLHRLGGERAERRATDEVFRTGGHDRHHMGAGIDQTATQLDRLVGGDATGHPEHDSLAGEFTRHA